MQGLHNCCHNDSGGSENRPVRRDRVEEKSDHRAVGVTLRMHAEHGALRQKGTEYVRWRPVSKDADGEEVERRCAECTTTMLREFSETIRAAARATSARASGSSSGYGSIEGKSMTRSTA